MRNLILLRRVTGRPKITETLKNFILYIFPLSFETIIHQCSFYVYFDDGFSIVSRNGHGVYDGEMGTETGKVIITEERGISIGDTTQKPLVK